MPHLKRNELDRKQFIETNMLDEATIARIFGLEFTFLCQRDAGRTIWIN